MNAKLKLCCFFRFNLNIGFNITLLCTLRTILAYQWLESNRNFDCAVGLSVDKKPISIGVIITRRSIITSANPWNQYLKNTKEIRIHFISKTYKNATIRKVHSVAANQSFRKTSWVRIGYNDTTHTTIHDIIVINVSENDAIIYYAKWTPDRHPFSVGLPQLNSAIYNEGWVFAGFGYIDHDHIIDNNVLEASDSSAVLTNCDEWIPREWGRFICLADQENLPGLASGAPLFHSGNMKTVLGIGNFMLKKDKDRVLVFTDLRHYANKLYGFSFK